MRRQQNGDNAGSRAQIGDARVPFQGHEIAQKHRVRSKPERAGLLKNAKALALQIAHALVRARHRPGNAVRNRRWNR